MQRRGGKAALRVAGRSKFSHMNTAPGSADRKLGRNEPCSCGSGRKYKKCCAPSGPADTAPINQLAALVGAGRYLELESGAREQLTRHPNSGVLWKLLGLSLWVQGKDALQALQKAADLLPDDAEAHSNLGNAFRAAGRLEHAVRSHGRALAIQPDYAEAHNNLGSALEDLGYLDEAMASFRRAIGIKPDFALAHSNLGNVLGLQSRALEAEASCHRALEINPRLTGAIVQLAEYQAGKGLFAEAEAALQGAIAIEPEMPEAWSGLVRWRKMTHGDSAWLDQVQRIVSRPLPPRREVPLRYALGKYFDDVKDYERAFMNFRRANELTKLFTPRYDRHEMTRNVDRTIHRYDRQWLDLTVVDTSSSSERPVFVVGMWRSGTTLAEQILATHSSVFGAGELPFWRHATAGYERSVLNGATGEYTLRALAGDYLTLLQEVSADAPRVVDKMCANFLHLGLIHAAYPKARIIHMRRNPMDTCLSIYFQNFQNTHLFANDLGDLAHYYREYLRIMEHWRLNLPASAILEVPYEGLLEDQEGWSRAMLDFIGLAWDPTCIHFDRAERSVSTFSKWQVRQPINSSSVERWRNYEQFVGPLRTLAQSSPRV
jgi:tetratricopeptide (TPR) repeat protein